MHMSRPKNLIPMGFVCWPTRARWLPLVCLSWLFNPLWAQSMGAEGSGRVSTQWLEGFDFQYLLTGQGPSSPLQVFDDGIDTWIQFERLGVSPLVLAKGEATPVEFKKEGNFLRVYGVFDQLMLHVKDEVYLITRRHPSPKRSTQLSSLGEARIQVPKTFDVDGVGPWARREERVDQNKSGLPGRNINVFDRQGGGALERRGAWPQLQESSARPPSLGHAYANPLSGDTLRYESEREVRIVGSNPSVIDREGSISNSISNSISSAPRSDLHPIQLIFKAHQSHLEPLQVKRLLAALRPVPKEARWTFLCTPPAWQPSHGAESLALEQADSPPVGGPKEREKRAALSHERASQVSALLHKEGFGMDSLGPKSPDPQVQGSAHEDSLGSTKAPCGNTWVLEWRLPPGEKPSTQHVLMEDQTLLNALQRLGGLKGWRVVSTDAPSVPVVKAVSLSGPGFIDMARELIHWANLAGYPVSGTTHEGQVLLLSKGEGLE
jgi:hypothetical protein